MQIFRPVITGKNAPLDIKCNGKVPDRNLMVRLDQVYCAHEYTAANAKFAVHVNPNNAALKQRQQEVKALRDKVRRFTGRSLLRTPILS